MRWIVVVLLVAWPVVASADDECAGVLGQYKGRLASAKTESRRYRKATMGYLRGIEKAFTKCFATQAGKALVAQRIELEKKNPPAVRRREPPPAPRERKAPPARRGPDYSSSGSTGGSTGGGWSVAPSRRIHPASAAFLSFVIPGAGQAVKNQPGLAWLFFLGSGAGYSIGAGIIASSARVGSKGLFYDPGAIAGGAIVMGIGGVLHLISIIHAGVAKEN